MNPPVPRPGQPNLSLLWSLLSGAVAFVIYALLAPPVSGDKDGSEFTLVLALGGIGHPTGYPVYSLMGHTWVSVLHAFGIPWAKGANLFSSLGGGVEVACMHALNVRLVALSPSIRPRALFFLACFPTAVFAFNPVWTYETTLAEVYSWHIAWVLGAALCFVTLASRMSSEERMSDRRGYVGSGLIWGFACGLGMAHHATAVLVILPLTLSLCWKLIRRRSALTGLLRGSLLGFAVPTAAYGFVAWRAFHPAVWQWPVLEPSWSGIIKHVTAAEYGHILWSFSPSAVQQGLLGDYVYPVLIPALLVLILAGVICRDPLRQSVLYSFASVGLLSTIFAFAYGVPDPSPYFLTPMAIALCGILPFASAIAAGSRKVPVLLSAGVGALALTTLVLVTIWTQVGVQRKAVLVEFDRLVHSMWQSIHLEQAIVLWPNDMFARLLEYQILAGEKPAISVWNPLLLAREHPRRRFRERHGFDPTVRVLPVMHDAHRTCSEASSAEEFARCVSENINERSPLPVVLFDPERRSVRLLRKPGHAEDRSVGGGW